MFSYLRSLKSSFSVTWSISPHFLPLSSPPLPGLVLVQPQQSLHFLDPAPFQDSNSKDFTYDIMGILLSSLSKGAAYVGCSKKLGIWDQSFSIPNFGQYLPKTCLGTAHKCDEIHTSLTIFTPAGKNSIYHLVTIC